MSYYFLLHLRSRRIRKGKLKIELVVLIGISPLAPGSEEMRLHKSAILPPQSIDSGSKLR